MFVENYIFVPMFSAQSRLPSPPSEYGKIHYLNIGT